MQASFVQKQQFGLKMNPQVFQSLKLMELPLVDLREKIEEELERNPALEVVEDRSTVSLDDAQPKQREFEEYFESSSDSGFIGRAGAAASDDHRRFIEGVLTRPETLQQHLLWQLQLEPVDDELRTIASVLIQNLDDDGFHKEPPESLFGKDKEPPLRLAEAMRLVQSLEPAGCCTADYRESLKVQVALLRNVSACMECSLDHLELFKQGKISQAAKKMRCGEDEARACFDLIKKLSPFPGRSFSAAEVRFVVPDLQVARDGNDFVIIINNEVIPVLGIHPFFRKLQPQRGKENKAAAAADAAARPAREFVRDNIREAKVFINSIAMRNQTLKMVARAIVNFQRAFFMSGPQRLVPLTLGDIARELDIHETTVSRTANGKYMQTEWGIFELRYFFTNSISGTGSGGSRFSKEGVKAIIHELISADQQNLSDSEISQTLARRGISLARRTVAKYRKELDLGSSYAR
jgi:RNA polymerase sigma-54 factor